MVTATATRTDIHRPSSPEFDPEAYVCHGVWDLNPEFPNPAAVQRRLETVNRLIAAGYRCGSHGLGQCGHCGAHIRYAALMVREDAREWIWVGETCLSGRFEALTKGEFQALREAAKLDRERQAKLAAWRELCDQHPGLAYASYAADIIDAYVSSSTRGDASDALHVRAGAAWALGTLADIAAKARRYGEVSDKQVAFVERLLAEVDAKISAQVAKDAAPQVDAPLAPEGKVVVEGVVTGVRWVENGYGGALKMRVAADAGWAVWSTVPASIADAPLRDETGEVVGTHSIDKGDRVRFTATLRRADDDPSFAFASRPTKGEILSAS